MGEAVIGRAYIIPTGNELREGVVLDTDSPMIMGLLCKLSPACEVTRISPVSDEQDEIVKQIRALAAKGASLIVLIGGSGGGHRHSSALSCDFTHSSMEELLRDAHSTALYGKNGHLWSKLVCGFLNSTLVINVPGPFQEAKAAMEAFVSVVQTHGFSPRQINAQMAAAVKAQFPVSAGD